MKSIATQFVAANQGTPKYFQLQGTEKLNHSSLMLFSSSFFFLLTTGRWWRHSEKPRPDPRPVE